MAATFGSKADGLITERALWIKSGHSEGLNQCAPHLLDGAMWAAFEFENYPSSPPAAVMIVLAIVTVDIGVSTAAIVSVATVVGVAGPVAIASAIAVANVPVRATVPVVMIL